MQQVIDLQDRVLKAETIRIKGTVQGVGFRPFVWQLAHQLALRGKVWNDAQGVVVQVWGYSDALKQFHQQLTKNTPPLATIDSLTIDELDHTSIPENFTIVESQQGKITTNVSADAATCQYCLDEIMDPDDRRYRYPFTNCTHCGPRISIIKAIPYDRKNTSMRDFKMCPECQREYDDPADRRFHAQPNACPVCGPSTWLENNNAEKIVNDKYIDDIAFAANLIKQGYIIAIKGIGGFHLACDATNQEAVATLRQRKKRYQKPFALMARDIEVTRKYCHVSEEEETLLKDKSAPIVILKKHKDVELPGEVAPCQNHIGFMLPYTPLHILLLEQFDFPVVMTSGNLSDEAQCITNEQAREQLGEITDYFLMHDRDIINRLDDSVARIIGGGPQLLRRARGYTPLPISLPEGFENSPPILAMGAELKNTFCLIKEGKAFVSQHQGDLEDVTVFEDYCQNIHLYQELFDHKPEIIAVDHHPEYLSTKYGHQLAEFKDIKLAKVQHHHAHIAACMAEHGIPLDTKPVLGIALDGLGYGENGELWGGEFILADYHHYDRLARFQPVSMPGGSRSIIEPWRNTFAHLQQSLGWNQVVKQYPELSFVEFMKDMPIDNLVTMIEKNINSPPVSSAGRLFDAVAALLDICRDNVNYEGQAAMQLEVLAEESNLESKPYRYEFIHNDDGPITINWQVFWTDILEDIDTGIDISMIASRFHHTLVDIMDKLVTTLSEKFSFNNIFLSGGVFQNRILLEGVQRKLVEKKFSVHIPRRLPANDGGISFGQGVIVAAHYLQAKNK